MSPPSPVEPNVTAPLESLFEGYPERVPSHDEALERDGSLRPHWQYVIRSLEALGGAELERRSNEVRRLLQEGGVTYNASDGSPRPWQLDPIPFTLSSEEWARVETALIQRAELFDAILADLYGPRDLVRQGRLPADLVFDHPGFVRPCDGITQKGPRQLVLYAADLVRGPDGELRVLGDRVQAPSGAGYALENRLVLRQVLPSLFRDAQVHRLAQFFRLVRMTLAAMSPRPVDEPTIVILTPGPRTQTYFEHASLANYLGYSLVQGQDLTVHDGCLWLESLGGERRVDVVLRRIDADYCDPLELRPDSRLGVPSLVEAWRRGNVAFANPLGTGVLENPGILPFLPALARHLLGQPLLMESVPTWWCGDPVAREHVLGNLDRLVVKPVARTSEASSIFAATLSAGERDALVSRIAARPHAFAAQDDFPGSSVPIVSDSRLEPRPAVLRAFLVARDDGYVVMPGGLTRVAPRDRPADSGPGGDLSKDTWVLASEPEKAVTLVPEPSLEISYVTPVLSARAAENFFWMARYAERAENTARLLRTVVDKRNETLEASDELQQRCLVHLLRAVTQVTATYPGFLGRAGETQIDDPEAELHSTLCDADRNGSLTFALRAMLAAADGVRDMVSADTLRVIHDVQDRLAFLRNHTPPDLGGVGEELDQIVINLVALSGLAVESTTRGTGWRFLDAGRRIERALFLSSLLRSLLSEVTAPDVESPVLDSLLAICESRITYRWRYRSALRVRTALELLLLDGTNPRSLRFQLDRLEAHVEELPRPETSLRLPPVTRLVIEASTALRLADPAILAVGLGESARRQELDQLLSRITHLLTQTSDALRDAYFAHAAGPFPFGPLVPRARGEET